jgi:single-strand DNA-binding protein
MSIYTNKVIIVGNLGQDPEIKPMENGEFAILSVATSEFFKNKEGESTQKTQWHNVVVYNQHFVNLIKQYPKKGDRVYIEGALETNDYKDDSGKTQYRTKIIVKNFGGDFQFDSNSKEKEISDQSHPQD